MCNKRRGLLSSVQRFFELGQSYRVYHGSSNSSRPRHGSGQNAIDINTPSNVISINTESRVALVEPDVPMDRPIEATIECGLVPPVVMEFPNITAGGGFSGTSGESSSFRHGPPNDTVNYIETAPGNGDIVQASHEERSDLIHGAAGAAGTLGIVTLMEVRLVEARKFVKTTYLALDNISDAVSEVQSRTNDPHVYYVDGIIFSREYSVIITGELVDTKPSECIVQTFSNAQDPWFYIHSRILGWPTRIHLLQSHPITKFFRWLLDDYSHARALEHALHASGILSQFVVQDLALPYDTTEAFIDWVDKELKMMPPWLCPLRKCALPTFHPVTESRHPKESGNEEKSLSNGAAMSQGMLNIGVCGWGPSDYWTCIGKSRALEEKLRELGGRKWLYAHTYYTEEEFWNEYDRPWYQGLKEKYFATTLPSVYDKVKVNLHAKWKTPSQWSQ